MSKKIKTLVYVASDAVVAKTYFCSEQGRKLKITIPRSFQVRDIYISFACDILSSQIINPFRQSVLKTKTGFCQFLNVMFYRVHH